MLIDLTDFCVSRLGVSIQDVQLHVGLQSGLFQLFYCLECSPYEDVFNDVQIIPKNQIDLPSLKLLGSPIY